jgi:hypothetical protein
MTIAVGVLAVLAVVISGLWFIHAVHLGHIKFSAKRVMLAAFEYAFLGAVAAFMIFLIGEAGRLIYHQWQRDEAWLWHQRKVVMADSGGYKAPPLCLGIDKAPLYLYEADGGSIKVFVVDGGLTVYGWSHEYRMLDGG